MSIEKKNIVQTIYETCIRYKSTNHLLLTSQHHLTILQTGFKTNPKLPRHRALI